MIQQFFNMTWTLLLSKVLVNDIPHMLDNEGSPVSDMGRSHFTWYYLAPFGIALNKVVGWECFHIGEEQLEELRKQGFRPEVLLEADVYELDHDPDTGEVEYLAGGGKHVLVSTIPSTLKPGARYTREELLAMVDPETGLRAFTPGDIDTAVSIGILATTSR